MESYPEISVVVPVRNEERYIERTVDYLLNQDYPSEKLEILIVVADSDDRTAEIVHQIEAKEPRVTYLHNPKGLSSAARNIGIKNARGEIITFIDGHIYIDNDQLLKNTARLIKEKEVSVLSRSQFLDTPENGFFQKAVSLARKSTIGHGLDSTIYTKEEIYVDPSSSGATYKKEVFEKVGYFDESFDACEDVEFNYRVAQAGFTSLTSMKLAVFYYPRASIMALFRQLKRYGTGRFRLARKHPKTLSIGTLVPVLLTIGFPLLAVLSFFSNIFLYLFALFAGPYFLAIIGWSVAISLKNGIKLMLTLPLIYPVIHAALGWGFVLEFLRFATARNITME